MPHHFVRVGSQITGCSNLYPLNASQSVSKIRLLVFTVSCFTVNKNGCVQLGVNEGSRRRADLSVRPSMHAYIAHITISGRNER